jgi:hypothetical protein
MLAVGGGHGVGVDIIVALIGDPCAVANGWVYIQGGARRMQRFLNDQLPHYACLYQT